MASKSTLLHFTFFVTFFVAGSEDSEFFAEAALAALGVLGGWICVVCVRRWGCVGQGHATSGRTDWDKNAERRQPALVTGSEQAEFRDLPQCIEQPTTDGGSFTVCRRVFSAKFAESNGHN
jgi:hypothetical protein